MYVYKYNLQTNKQPYNFSRFIAYDYINVAEHDTLLSFLVLYLLFEEKQNNNKKTP